MAKPLPVTWLAGKRVRLRPLETEDVPLLRRFGLPLGSRGTIFIVQTTKGRDIGTLGFAIRGRQAAIGLNMDSKRRWTDGSAAEALRLMREGAFLSQPLVRMESLVRVDQPVVLAAFRRAGFKKEGVLRSALSLRQIFKDASIVSALANG